MKSALATRNLFARVFIHGLVVLLASTATFLAFVVLVIRPVIERDMLEVGGWAIPQVCAQLINKTRPAHRPTLAATAYSTDGSMIYSFIGPPLPPLSEREINRLRIEKAIVFLGVPPFQARWCKDTPNVYVKLAPPPLPGALFWSVGLVVIVVALASMPLANSIAVPITKLARVTKSFGRGELTARSDVVSRDEVGELAAAFNQMADRVQRVIRVEQELLANVSQELRTPLTQMRAVLETALENPERAQYLLREVDHDLRDLERHIETVMETAWLHPDTSHASIERRRARFAPIDMTGLVTKAMGRFSVMHPERKLVFEVDGDDHEAYADDRLILRLLEILLDSAHKCSDRAVPIVVRLGRCDDDALVHLQVTDVGMGLESSDPPRIFEPSFQNTQVRSQNLRGVELGLTLVRKVALTHGADLVIASEPGVGTTVRIALPRHRPVEHGRGLG